MNKPENFDDMYLICYKPKSFKGCHKEKFTETYLEALKFVNRVEKLGSTILAIYAPNGFVCYHYRFKKLYTPLFERNN